MGLELIGNLHEICDTSSTGNVDLGMVKPQQ